MSREEIVKKINRIMGKISSNVVIKSMTSGMIATMPLTIGTFLIAIFASLPIPFWQSFLTKTGIINDMNAVIGGTTEIISIFIVIAISYNFAKLKKLSILTSVILSVGSFFILMPQKISISPDKVINAFSKEYIGSTGIFVGLLVSICISYLYYKLDKKGLSLKLPSVIPPYVSEAFSSTFISIIIFTVVFFVRLGFSQTSFENIFNFFRDVITAPIMGIGGSTIAVIGLSVLSNFIWFFGIHPNTLLTATMPVFMTALTGNIEAFQSGRPLPFLTYAVLTFGFLTLGGAGGTIGLAVNLILFSKSERYKALGKLAIIPSIFNINEPLIFGTPILLNPIYFLPMVLSSIVTSIIGLIFIKFGAFKSYNPLINIPNVMPTPITMLINTGLIAMLSVILGILALTILYYPFFKLADRRVLEEEKMMKVENN